ncbi:MAG: NAD(+)/NADH kinase, partial [Desulfurococcaceae archaeon]
MSEVTIVYKPSGTCLNILSECLNELGKTGFRAKALWIDEVDKGTLDSAEIIIALGGDGTLLRISWSLRSSEPLIIPIPCGRRTFFYENLGELKFSEILSKFVNGEFFIER